VEKCPIEEMKKRDNWSEFSGCFVCIHATLLHQPTAFADGNCGEKGQWTKFGTRQEVPRLLRRFAALAIMRLDYLSVERFGDGVTRPMRSDKMNK
jgi:hypothetical protein